MHVHALAGPGAYTLLATVKPGETWPASRPFPVTIDPIPAAPRLGDG